MDVERQSIHNKLIAIARARETTYYSDVAPLAGLNMASEFDRIRIAQVLDEISRGEHSDGKPLLSAVVILKEENVPGKGFFNLARKLGLHGGGDDHTFWIEELGRVHSHWTAT